MPKDALIGVDVGGTKTALVISLRPPEVLDRIEFPTRPAKGPEPALRQIKQGIHDLISKHGLKIKAIGVSCGARNLRCQLRALSIRIPFPVTLFRNGAVVRIIAWFH